MQVSWLRLHHIACLPITIGYSDMSDDTLPLQWRDRAGLSPASLLAASRITKSGTQDCIKLHYYYIAVSPIRQTKTAQKLHRLS